MARRVILSDRIEALGEAATLSRGRSPDEVVQAASDVVQRADQRLRISGEHTVIAMAGATGSGKSSLFNAMTGTQLATTGVTRPTTSEPLAAVWGTELPTELLDWLEIRRRHLIASQEGPLSDLVLLDLPDHDSTEVKHRLTVDRLVNFVDMLVWVVDPQKYADAALHEGYLIPLKEYADVMVVVLNQSDRLTPVELQAAQADLRRLLDAEGLAATPMVTTSAISGHGVADLRAMLTSVVAKKTAKASRFSADITKHASALADTLGVDKVPTIDASIEKQLNVTMGEAAGVPVVVDAVREAWKLRGRRATGWPVLAWMNKLRPDPLKRLRVGVDPKELSPTTINRTSLPKTSAVQKAHVDTAVREVINAASVGLPRGWADAVRNAARGEQRLLADKLDAAIADTDFRMDSGRGWWVIVTILQWLLFLAACFGLGWLLTPLVLSLVQFNVGMPTVKWWGLPAPTVLVVGGVVGGLLLSLLSRVLVSVGAALKARRARRLLTAKVAEVTQTEVIEPVMAELDRLEDARDLTKMAGGHPIVRRRRKKNKKSKKK